MALEILKEHPFSTTKEIKTILKKNYKPTSYDLRKSPTRKNEPTYDQIIRNLNSHYKDHNDFSKHTNRYKNEKGEYCFVLKEDKLNEDTYFNSYLQTIDEIEFQKKVNTIQPYSKEKLEKANNRKPELLNKSFPDYYKKDPGVTKTAILKNNFKCFLEGKLSNHEHPTFLNNLNILYLEGHHLVPMKFQKDYKNINLDCIDNLIPLCVTCHKAIHNGNEEVVKEHLLPLFNSKKDEIKNLINEDLTFETFYKKFYKK